MTNWKVRAIIVFVLVALLLTVIIKTEVDGRSIIEHKNGINPMRSILKATQDPLYFSQKEFTVQQGNKLMINFGVKNTKNQTSHINIDIEYLNENITIPVLSSKTITGAGGAFLWGDDSQKFDPNEGRVFQTLYKAPEGKADYKFKFKITEEGNRTAIAEKIITIRVI